MKPNRETLLARILDEPWALPDVTLSTIVTGLMQRPDLEWTAAVARQPAAPSRAGVIAVIPVYGVLDQHPSVLDEFFGVTPIGQVRDAFRAALADQRVRAIVLDIDSPGGGVYGITELAAEIRAARGQNVRIVAVANSLMASAAYWLGSQADEVVVSPSGSVGSIGVIAVHQEVSRALEAEGITTTIISSGPYKTEGNPYQPLTDDARAHLQERSDAFYQQFIADVAKGRNVGVEQVRASFGEGRVVLARQAVAAGMADRVETFDQVMTRLQRATGASIGVGALARWVDFDAVAVPRHETPTDEGTWDGPANEQRLPSPMSVAVARRAYAWIDESRVENDEVVKDAAAFIHHEVDAEGSPGAANLTGCSTGIGYCNRGSLSDAPWWDDRRGIYEHLAGHMRDAGMEPPEMMGQAPFRERVAALASEAAALVHAAEHRARSRAAAGRPSFSTTTEAALRASRDAIDALLTGEPAASADPAPTGEPDGAAPVVTGAKSPVPHAGPPAISREEFLRRLRSH